MIAIFPGVYTRIVDQSFYIRMIPSTIGFLPFFSEKGPDNKLMLIQDAETLIKTFGEPNKRRYGEGLYVAYQFTMSHGALYGMRLLPDDATYANIGIKYDSNGPANSAESLQNINSIAELETQANLNNYAVVFYPIGRGEYYNKIGIRLTPSVNYTEAYTLDIYQRDPVDNEWILAESFDITFTDFRDITGEQMRADYVLEKYSEILRCHINDDVIEDSMNVGDYVNLFATITELQNGSDGTGLYTSRGALDLNSSVTKSLLVDAYTGLVDEAVIDTEFVYFSLVFDAGYPADVKTAIVQLCETIRGDCIAILDNGDHTRASDALAERTSGDTSTYNTFYAALYECYSKIFDNFTGQDIWITPVYHMARIIPMTDYNFELWYPPAGLTRGMVYAKELRYDLKGAFKDQFKLNQINPIMHFRQGYVVWGEWTTYRKPSVLQWIHVVRLLLWIKRTLEENLRYFIWELNLPQTRDLIRRAVVEFLNEVQNRGALEMFNVKVYSTEYDRKRGVVRVDITLKPVGAIEIILVTLFVK